MGTAVWPRGGPRAPRRLGSGWPVGGSHPRASSGKGRLARPSEPRQGSATSGSRLPSGSTLMGQELGPNPSRFFTFLLCDPGEPGPGSLVRRVSPWRRKDSPRPGPVGAAPQPPPSTKPSLQSKSPEDTTMPPDPSSPQTDWSIAGMVMEVGSRPGLEAHVSQSCFFCVKGSAGHATPWSSHPRASTFHGPSLTSCVASGTCTHPRRGGTPPTWTP